MLQMQLNLLRIFLITVALLFGLGVDAHSSRIVLASTTSADNSGLYDYLLPKFTAETGIEVAVIAVGTGQAIKIGERGDADVLVVHDPPSEEAFMQSGHGIERRTFMYNDYVLVGPKQDLDRLRQYQDASISEVMEIIATNEKVFISRGDDSGTHKRELSLWELIGVTPHPVGSWYREAGAGMGAVLNIANELLAYTLSDRATWISFNNRRNLTIIKENVPPLYNPYSIMLVNPAKHSGVNHRAARQFSDWITSQTGLTWITQFRVKDVQLFYPIQ